MSSKYCGVEFGTKVATGMIQVEWKICHLYGAHEVLPAKVKHFHIQSWNSLH